MNRGDCAISWIQYLCCQNIQQMIASILFRLIFWFGQMRRLNSCYKGLLIDLEHNGVELHLTRVFKNGIIFTLMNTLLYNKKTY